MKIMVMDGQGGRMGKGIVEQIKRNFPEDEVLAVGTNSIATAAMLKAGADAGATGENPAVVGSRDADVIIGPMGIVIADSLLGEITPKMAVARTEPGQKAVNPCKSLPAFCDRMRRAAVWRLREAGDGEAQRDQARVMNFQQRRGEFCKT